MSIMLLIEVATSVSCMDNIRASSWVLMLHVMFKSQCIFGI